MSETKWLFIRRSQNHFSPQSAYPFTFCRGTVLLLRSNTGLTDLVTWGGKKNCIDIRNACKAKNQAMRHSPRLRQRKKRTQENQVPPVKWKKTTIYMTTLELQKMWGHSHQHRPLSSSTRMQRSQIIPHLPPCKSSGTVATDQQTPDNLLPSSEFFMYSNSWSPLGLKGALQCFGVCQTFCLALKCCLPLFDAPLLLFISKNTLKIAVPAIFLLTGISCYSPAEWSDYFRIPLVLAPLLTAA